MVTVSMILILVVFPTMTLGEALAQPAAPPAIEAPAPPVVGAPAPPPAPPAAGPPAAPQAAAAEESPKSVQDRLKECRMDKKSPVPLGDFTIFKTNWSVGPAVSTQLIRYDLASKRAAFNASVGAGASFRWYPDVEFGDKSTLSIKQIKPECRANSLSAVSIDDDPKNGKIGSPFLSITPTIYASKLENDDLAVQPAILLGFFRDILNFGTGFNLSGPNKGHVFLLFSVGIGFNF